MHISFSVSACLPVCLSVSVSVSVCLSVCPSLSLPLSVCLSVCLSLSLSLSLSLHMKVFAHQIRFRANLPHRCLFPFNNKFRDIGGRFRLVTLTGWSALKPAFRTISKQHSTLFWLLYAKSLLQSILRTIFLESSTEILAWW